MKRVWLIIAVSDVPASAQWYMSLPGAGQTHPGGTHEWPTLTSPSNGEIRAENGRSLRMLTQAGEITSSTRVRRSFTLLASFLSGNSRNDLSMILTNASDADIPDLMTWFHDARSTQEWGGWAFRYPFDEKTFRADVQLNELDSFVVRSESGELIAFGQVRNKFGRGHVARLAVAPRYRGRGLGRDLVSSLCQKAIELFDCSENSLFVSKTNVAALRCYTGLGFCKAPYPRDDGVEQKTLFMIREIAAN